MRNQNNDSMTRNLSQSSILAPSKPYGLSLTFRAILNIDPEQALKRLREVFDLEAGIVGLGEPLIRNLKKTVPGLRTFPAFSGPACTVPSTQGSLWVLVGGENRTEVFQRSESLLKHLNKDFILEDSMDTFIFSGGKDLTGYEDGTANPNDAESPKVALVDRGKDLQGSSFVAIQRWIHDLDLFHSQSKGQRDNIIGRNQETNEEIRNAPISAHIKRSEQESYTPAAFMLRRSMPWARNHERGLEFIAFGKDLDAFERVLSHRMRPFSIPFFQNFQYFEHGNPLLDYPDSFHMVYGKTIETESEYPRNFGCSAGGVSGGGNHGRNKWQSCIGIGGNHGSELVAIMRRNMHAIVRFIDAQTLCQSILIHRKPAITNKQETLPHCRKRDIVGRIVGSRWIPLVLPEKGRITDEGGPGVPFSSGIWGGGHEKVSGKGPISGDASES